MSERCCTYNFLIQIIRKGQQDLIEDSLTHLRTVRNSYLQAVASLVASLHQSRFATKFITILCLNNTI